MALLTELKEALVVISTVKQVVSALKDLFGVPDNESLITALKDLETQAVELKKSQDQPKQES